MTLASPHRLSTADVCAIAGLPPSTVTRWIDEGVITPAAGGGRRGAERSWTPVQALALTAGAAYRAEGASPGRVAGVVRFLSGVRPEVLERDIAAGRTFPAPGVMLGAAWIPGLMVKPPVDDPGLSPAARVLIHKLDLARLRERVLEAIAGRPDRPPESTAPRPESTT